LLSSSAAIDRGLVGGNSEFDQRGNFFVQHAGPRLLTDMGAYEVQQGTSFNAGFDGCLAL